MSLRKCPFIEIEKHIPHVHLNSYLKRNQSSVNWGHIQGVAHGAKVVEASRPPPLRQRLGLMAALLLLALSLVAMIAPAVAPYDPAEQWRDAGRMGQPLALGFHSIVRGNLGDSYYFHRPVTALLAEKLPTTAFMAGLIMLTALAIGIPLGMVAAV